MPRFRLNVSVLAFVVFMSSIASDVAAQTPKLPPVGSSEVKWQLVLDGFFQGGRKPLFIYAREDDGQWLAGVGSSRDPQKRGGKTYNRSWYCADLSTVPIRDGVMKGRFTVHMTPDLWIPFDHEPYRVVVEVDAKRNGAGKLSGTYKVVEVTSDDPSAKALGKGGRFSATGQLATQPDLPAETSFTCNMQGALVGGAKNYGNRCMVLTLGVEDGKLVAADQGRMSKKLRTYDREGFSHPDNSVSVSKNGFTAKITVPAETLDLEPCLYVYEMKGQLFNELVVGMYTLTVRRQGQPDIRKQGSFDGRWREGIQRLPEPDRRPWTVTVPGHQAPKPGEHPRLLFRKSDVKALQAKARTPQGQAILKRLRFLLDGDDGEQMTTIFSKATHAYMGGGFRNTVKDTPGVYTIGHAAGYGLLYQLTGDTKYAEFAKQCFEKALAGQRDRDDRYSFRNPGGALRAGPSLGWHAVAYDLCYDAWDPATRKKFGLAIAQYTTNPSLSEEEDKQTRAKGVDLEALARGTMPPSSNHYGMQVGGAAMALLAVDGEEFVDQKRIDRLLRVVKDSLTRNLYQGFGDGGFFAEGDGTGSMSSQIVFLSALSAWANARGEDFIAAERPNARMMTLKWVYGTVYNNGRPSFWPIRGSYGHNVWNRGGVSGAGYFAFGMGGVRPKEQAAMKWAYQRFLADHDAKSGHPYDTASRYPQAAVASFINWPVDVEPVQPDQVLPRCYRDTIHGFYAWRNRWQDANDTVITLLTQRTSGYMSAKPDKGLCLQTMGRRERWGSLKSGQTVYWNASEMGHTSSLTLADGTCFGVDFTGASGADVMLVTTGKAKGATVKLGNQQLTFYFPTSDAPPTPKVVGQTVVVGKQRVSLDKDHLAFETAEP